MDSKRKKKRKRKRRMEVVRNMDTERKTMRKIRGIKKKTKRRMEF